MGFQCVPQIKGLVVGDGMRKDGKGQAKHRANAAAIIHEAFEIADPDDGHAIPIRKSASETYDKSRTKNNKYQGPRTADDVLRLLYEEADKQRVEVKTVDKKTGQTVIRKRALPSTTVLGVAVIFNPPSEVAMNWTPEQYDKFFADCEEVMAQMPCGKRDKKGNIIGTEHYIFRPENIIASAEHWDEGTPMDPPVYTGHIHKIYKPEDQDGKYYGKFIDAYFLSYVNKNFARMMRDRGWDIDDPDCTDWEKFEGDDAYRTKRKSKIREGGKPVNNYIADKKRKDAEATLDEAREMLDKAAGLHHDKVVQVEAEIEAIRTEAAIEAGEAIRQAVAEAELDARAEKEDRIIEAEIEAATIRAEAMADAEKINKEKEQAETDRDRAKRELAEADAMKNELIRKQEAAQQELENIQMKGELIKSGIALLEGIRSDMQKELAAQEAARDSANAKAKTVKAAAEAARAEKARLEQEVAVIRQQLDVGKAAREKIKLDAEAAKADRDAAQKEAGELRRNAVARAEQAAKATQVQIETEAREAWKNWLARKKQRTEDTVKKIIDDAKFKAAEIIASAAEAAQGEYAFLLRWLDEPRQRYKSGESFLEVARKAHRTEIREQRVSAIPSKVRDAGKGQQAGPEQDGPRT